ncbi:Gfo/Idh/MocA family protein [Tautonia sociabilis]|uniref:Gfo/Idh/MocA family oxidoreductase n=1 Tax=Tautonia sociabilis TaxID=2080755 RepID=A0A432MHF7_9BACT|nr:Gfo/Idh/MocA family oxidoreductase [Tautonia sociabilis]RUL86224.1 gfo/Idh/MocA family oxidoreductase [Tautonia sociabilis]
MTGPNPSRRSFLRSSAAAAVGTASLAGVPNAFAAGSDTIKVGVVGCGGRGTGAAENICEAASQAVSLKLHALADVFQDRVDQCADRLAKNDVVGDKFDVAPDRKFVGFDAFEKVIDCCDLVILATPPGFRPQHIEAVIKAGKNLFCEKPVAVDGPGIRKVLAAAKLAKEKNLAVVTGTQRRHQAGYIESMKQIADGAIGDVITARVFWNQGNIWVRDRLPGMDDMAYQLHNWYHFLWLCGDHIVEQHVHNLDVARWAFGDEHPVSCVGMGGRQVNDGPGFGQSYDHFAVDYAFADGRHVLSMCRQIDGCAKDVSEYIVGSKGTAHLMPGNYSFPSGRLRVRSEINPYVQEHIDLLNSIATGEPLNELERVAHSTLMAIMGRDSAYTGKEITWEEALNSELDTFPKELAFGPRPEIVIPKPGVTNYS